MTALNRLLIIIAAALMLSNTEAGSLSATQQPVSGYLGMGIDKVPQSVRAHLPDGVAESQGLLVTRFSDESPAADDGIKLYDVLIAYDEQPIDDPVKFIQKIRNDKPGRQVTFQLVRQGVLVSVTVKMGQQKIASDAPIEKTPPKQKTGAVQAVPLANSWQPYPNFPRYQQPYMGNRYPGYSGAPVNTQQYQPSVPKLNIAGKPSFPMRKKVVKKKHAWGDERNIWPDFYTDSTNDMWDTLMNGPFKMGRMPGGWRAPSLSTPDPVTIGDAVTNQLPPMAEEMGNMADFAN